MPVSSRKAQTAALASLPLPLLPLLLLLTLLLLAAGAQPATARPSNWRAGELHECHAKADTEALCQRCAKSTKSPMVYPLCCRNEEQVRSWCHRYLTYGLH